MDIDVYPDAHHGFDVPSNPMHYRPEVRNVSAPKGWGATVGSHPEARAKALARTTEWLKKEPSTAFHVEQRVGPPSAFP